MKLLGKYINGNYTVSIYNDGTKIRENDLDNLTPAFAENCDVTITNRCDGACGFCYAGCTSNGKHGNLNHPCLDTIPPYTELAINGNDLSHPDLIPFLKKRKKLLFLINCALIRNKEYI
jgi:hypothetical protein